MTERRRRSVGEVGGGKIFTPDVTRPIRADRIVLELTADEAPPPLLPHLFGGLRVHSGHRVQSAQVIVDDPQTQTFVGHVVFTEQTPSGALEIKADRLERLTGPFAGV